MKGRLALWTLLIPLTYLPLYLMGTRPGPAAFLLLAAAVALAALAVLFVTRTTVLDRIEPAIGRRARPTIAIAIVAYVAIAVRVAHARLVTFRTYDQAARFSQCCWSLLHGHGFANAAQAVDGTLGRHAGMHFSPTLFLCVPFYAIAPGPLMLLAIQALAVALTVVPLYHLLRRDNRASVALVLSLAALAIPSFGWAGVRDFHDANFLPPLLITAVWAIEARRPAILAIAALGALGLREDLGITLVLLGAWALLRGAGARIALGLAALGAAWMIVVIKLVMPRFGPAGSWIDATGSFADALGQWGATPGAAARAMLSHPIAFAHALFNGQSIRYLYDLLSPLLMLPPFGDPIFLVGMPGLSVLLLSRLGFMRFAAQSHSVVPLTFFALAALRTATRTISHAPLARRPAHGLALGTVMLCGALPALPLSSGDFPYPVPPLAAARAACELIPEGAAVYAPISFYPTLGDRERFGCWEHLGERGREPEVRGSYDYIVLWPDADPAAEPHDRPLADSLATDPRFRAVAGYDPLRVFVRR
jgi:uncharacterized membrane protein